MCSKSLLTIVAVSTAVLSTNAVAQIVTSVKLAQAPDVNAILQHGGTAALLVLMFWLLVDERKQRREYEAERVKLLKETLEAVNKMTVAVTDSAKVLERLAVTITEFGAALERVARNVERLLESSKGDRG